MLLLNCQADLERACFPRTFAVSAPQQDPIGFQALFSGEGELESKPDPPLPPSSPPLAEVAQQKSQADNDLKAERTRETVKHVGCYRSKSRDFTKESNFFHLSMDLLCMCFKHNMKQEEKSFRVPTWSERAMQLHDN